MLRAQIDDHLGTERIIFRDHRGMLVLQPFVYGFLVIWKKCQLHFAFNRTLRWKYVVAHANLLKRGFDNRNAKKTKPILNSKPYRQALVQNFFSKK